MSKDAISNKVIYKIPTRLAERVESFMFSILPSGTTIAKVKVITKKTVELIENEYNELNHSKIVDKNNESN